MRVTHSETTRSLGTVFPLVGSTAPPCREVPIGVSNSGGVFCFDPFELYAKGHLTSPNVFVLGQVGKGKSAFVKCFLNRSVALGRWIFVLDPKGEYGELCQATGAAFVSLRPFDGWRIDPFEPGIPGAHLSSREAKEGVNRLMRALLGRALTSVERLVLETATTDCASNEVISLEGLWRKLGESSNEGLSRKWECDPALIGEARMSMYVEISRLIDGDLAGVVGTEGSLRSLPRSAVIDLSQLYGTPALALVVNLVLAQRLRQMREGRLGQGHLVLDEAWAVLELPELARWFRSLWKLARSYGSANVAVTHRISDLGKDQTEVDSLSMGLLADSESFVIYGQPPVEARRTGEYLGLSSSVTQMLSELPRGSAYWRVANSHYVVRHLVDISEKSLVNTDAAMGNPKK